MRSVRVFLLLMVFCLLFSNCHEEKNEGRNSFCYWKTTFNFTEEEREQWAETGADHLYIRYFDIDWNEAEQMAMPVGTIAWNDSLPAKQFTPSVFITNRVFEKTEKDELAILSKKIRQRIDEITARQIPMKAESSCTDILIDCDWTEKTKDKFFYFLEQMKTEFPEKQITVTLRLWQYKYRTKAGIPPAERCLLMCYNMQMANEYDAENSIGSLDELKKYIIEKKYPLQLDIAFPVFSWTILFRNQRFIGFLGEDARNIIVDNQEEYEKLSPSRYRLLTDQVIGPYFARRGDEIRIEMVSLPELEKMTGFLKKKVSLERSSRITLFSWNKQDIQTYGTNEIKELYTVFSK